jgi:hypothetical protein
MKGAAVQYAQLAPFAFKRGGAGCTASAYFVLVYCRHHQLLTKCL